MAHKFKNNFIHSGPRRGVNLGTYNGLDYVGYIKEAKTQ